MINRALGAGAIAASLLAPASWAATAASPPLAIVGATLIDGTGAPPVQDAVVLIRDGRIAAVGPAASTDVPPGAVRVDAHGKWLLPGLIDMHVHMDEVLTPAMFVRYGVTSVRDVGSRLVTIQRLRARAARGEPIPRLFWLGRNIDEGKPSWWGAVAVKGPDEVPALLDDMERQGVDGVKLYVRAGPKVAAAVIRDAHRRGWPVTGHLEDTRPSVAAALGIDNLEHAFTLVAELRKAPAKSVQGYRRAFANAGEISLTDAKAVRLIDSLEQHRVALTATLVSTTMPVEGKVGALRAYAGWATIPNEWTKYWGTSYWSFMSTTGWTPSDYRSARAAYSKCEEMVRALHRGGVTIVAGTDTPAPWVLPGASLLYEMELLHGCGLSTMESILAATGLAARVLHRSDEIGTIAVGLRADLLLLDADPLADIRNLRRIDAVYMGGHRL